MSTCAFAFAIGAPWGERAVERSGLTGPTMWHNAESTIPLPRYFFFLNWRTLVADSLLCHCECVNFHCTTLPYGRGGHPIENLIKRGHLETVITAHRMTEELDAGPIYGTRGPISLAGTKADIHQRFIEPCAELMRWIVETEPIPVPQQGEPTYFRRLGKAEYDAFWAAREADSRDLRASRR